MHFETYNPVVAADQMQDLATVVAWARSQPDVREVSLVGQDLSGPQVLLARPVLDGLARTAVELNDLADPQGTGPYPAQIDLPGMYQFGGFNTAAALVAPAPLWIYGASPRFDNSSTKDRIRTERCQSCPSARFTRAERRSDRGMDRSRRLTWLYNAPRRSNAL